jgi:hypothetical protein
VAPNTIPAALAGTLTPEQLSEIDRVQRAYTFDTADLKRRVDEQAREIERLTAENASTEAKVRESIAEDFVRQGKASDTLNWGQAVYIARDGLCSCSGGIKPCDMGGTR